MHYFSELFYFDVQIYMFRRGLLSIIRSLDTVFTAIGILKFHYDFKSHLRYLIKHSVVLMTVVHTYFYISVWQIPIAVNTVLRLLMMDRKSVQNM